MPTTRREATQDLYALTPGERDWIRRQGRAARMLEARQRRAAPVARRQARPSRKRRSAPPA